VRPPRWGAQARLRKSTRRGGRAIAVKGDIAVETDVLGMFDAATKALGPLSAVIANAGIVAPTARLAEMSVERMRRVFEVNVLGAYLTAREATRRMSKSFGGAGGSIVMMSSAAARLGSPNLYVDYAGSKGAIDTLTLGLAKELGAEGAFGDCLDDGVGRFRVLAIIDTDSPTISTGEQGAGAADAARGASDKEGFGGHV
jgi:NAD(P)-dependent dehydrogenase (short-subunit alcohol dehydrogenase family)